MSKKFIPGIYNYCDRWCERCTFTSRCRNYEDTSNLTPEELDIHNKAFWENIASNFAKAITLLKKMAAEKGIDLEAEASEYEKKRPTIKAEIKDSVIIKLCREYRNVVMPFLDNELNTILENGTHELQSHLDLGIHSEEQAVKLLSAMTDSVEVIKWYLFFMDAKLNRAFLGKRENDKIEEDYQSDSNGSAKIALLAIDRSMGAWAKILSLLPNTEDVSLKSLALLSKIKELASKEFPDASKFIRPGFDDKIK